MPTEKQDQYLDTLERATDAVDAIPDDFCVGCCTALSAAAPNPGVGIDLVTLLMVTYHDHTQALFWWPTTAEGAVQRVIALSFMMDMIETENLYAD